LKIWGTIYFAIDNYQVLLLTTTHRFVSTSATRPSLPINMEAGNILQQSLRTVKLSRQYRYFSGRNHHHAARARPRINPQLCQNIKSQRRGAKQYARAPSRFEQMILDARTRFPILFPVSLFAALFASIGMIGIGLDQRRREKNAGSSAFPPAVEDQLRLALHYTHISPDPDTASKYFMQAIKKAEEVGMDPFGKETLGIRVRFAQMLEDFGHVKSSIELLEGVNTDLTQGLEELDRTHGITSETSSQLDTEIASFRANLIKGIVNMKVKISSLYESDYLQDSAKAKQVLSDAVGLVVKETRSPQNGLSEDNGAGLTNDEIAAMLSQMGDLYATSGEEENAVQLYMLTLQPLRAACNGTKSCKEVQVLSNIASAMDMALKKPNPIVNGRSATKDSLAAARRAALRWADQAIATSDSIETTQQDEICMAALISAQMTRADLLLDSGDKTSAKEAYNRLLPVLWEKNLHPLISSAEQGLKRAST
jgi:hypothetical protein